MTSWISSLPYHVLLLVYMSTVPESGRGPPPWAVSGRPQFSRPATTEPDVAVATSPPSVTDAQDSGAVAITASSGATASVAGGQLVSATTAAEFKYPSGDLTINSIDSVVIEYDTVWTDLELGVNCQGAGVGGSKSYDLSLASSNGPYTLEPVDSEIIVSEYPIECSLVLRSGQSVAYFENGPTLSIISTAGVASTYGISATSTGGSSKTASATNAKETDPKASSTSAGPSGTSTTNADSAATETGVAGASTSKSSSTGLSSGASAGIAIGVLLAVGLLLLALWFFYRQRRRMRGMENELEETRREHEKVTRHADGILMAAGKPDTRNGGRVVMTDAPNRGSGEWKKFFNARAASPAGGVGSVGGTASPARSRLGTGAERPKTAEALPPIPDSPTASAGRSDFGGEAVAAADMVGRR